MSSSSELLYIEVESPCDGGLFILPFFVEDGDDDDDDAPVNLTISDDKSC